MNVYTASLAIDANNRVVSPKSGAPSTLEEAKSEAKSDQLATQAEDEVTGMLNRFRTAASQLAGIDNKNWIPEPVKPGKLDSWLHPEKVAQYNEESSARAAFNGRDLSPDLGHVITTADSNSLGSYGVNGELLFHSKSFGANGSLVTNVDKLIYEDVRFNDDHTDSAESLKLTSNGTQDVYLMTTTTSGPSTPEYKTTQTLTVDHALGTAQYQNELTPQEFG